MKKSELKELIKNILKEQGAGPRPSMNKGMKMRGTLRKQTGGGNIMCVCANGSTCRATYIESTGQYDCSCCVR